MTGQYARTHGVQNNLTPWSNDNVTFLEILKKAGYDTAFIGKWHMPGRLPELRGVDHFVTFTVEGGQGRYFDCPLIVNGVETASRKSYVTEELTDYALEFISRKRENPFCLYLSHKAVHHQFLPPHELNGLYDEAQLAAMDEQDHMFPYTRGNMLHGLLLPLEHYWRNYCEALVAMDREIGRVLDKLDEMGVAEDTVVVYAGDNGYLWGEHRLIDKRWPYKESIRIPLIVRYPKLMPDPGRRADQMVLNVDLAPSLLEAAGAPVPANIEGRSFLPILRSASTPGRTAWRYEYYKDFPYNVPQSDAVRTRTHIYIEWAGRRPPELYDIVNDSKQTHNLIGTPEGDRLLPDFKEMLDLLKAGEEL